MKKLNYYKDVRYKISEYSETQKARLRDDGGKKSKGTLRGGGENLVGGELHQVRLR